VSALVFVYGTLRSGHSNHRLLSGCRLIGPHTTAPLYTMLNLGAYPGVVTDGRNAIVGEVYAVSPRRLVQLDRLEGYPRLYDRRLIPTTYGPAWMYLYLQPHRHFGRVPSGDWNRR
jgi:gamma-glutamylcyclotransferase (GGCT)/AIG2-like uncharacterized protein YtfP